MNPKTRRWTRAIGAAMIALGLSLSVAPAARAQEAEGGEASEGRPLDGYAGTFILAALAVFIIGKSARR